MALFRVHRMKDNPRLQFRWAPHASGLTQIKPRDFEPAGEIEATSFYAAWTALKNSGSPLQVGDVLEDTTGALGIFKYVGFEEACWVLPEVKSGLENEPLAVGGGV